MERICKNFEGDGSVSDTLTPCEFADSENLTPPTYEDQSVESNVDLGSIDVQMSEQTQFSGKDRKIIEADRLLKQLEDVEEIKWKNCTFLWGIWHYDNESTLLLEEEDIDKFPEGSLTVTTQKWRTIKLSGRPIEFDETGVVSSMSKVEKNSPCLNISTATTNCTLVPEELLAETLRGLSETLKIRVEPYQ